MDAVERNWISGMIPVRSAVEGARRDVFRVLVQNDRLDGNTARLQQAARDRGILLERVSQQTIDGFVDSSRHDGVAAEVGPRRFVNLVELLDESTPAAIFMLDGVEDPYNLGQAIRSLYAAGATGLVLRHRNWLTAGETVLRSSAGASELMSIAVADDPQAAADFYRTRGLAIMAASKSDAIPLGDADLSGPFFLVIGGEKRGLSRPFQREVDMRVTIPYGRPFDGALGVAAASAVLGFEMLRQRRGSPTGG